MTLSEKEERLVQSLRSLSQEAAEQVIQWTTQLADLVRARKVQWSDAWTDEDMQDATAASIRNCDQEERNGH